MKSLALRLLVGPAAAAMRAWMPVAFVVALTIAPSVSISAPVDDQLAEAKAKAAQGDFKPLLSFYEDGAAKGYAFAQEGLGQLYEKGLGVERNDAKAASLYRSAAEQGLNTPDADRHLARMYERGAGVNRDVARALMWLDVSLQPDWGPRTDSYKAAVAERDELKSKMTPDEISAAGALEAAWFQQHPIPKLPL